MLQSVQVDDGCRGSRVAGLEMMRVMAFHFFPAAAPGVGAGGRSTGAFLDRTLAVRVVDESLRKQSSCGRNGDGFSTVRCRGNQGNVALVNIV